MSFSTTEALPRAGFWRRWLSTIIDIVIVGAPFQVVVAILFAATAGHVQITNSGFVIQACRARTSIPPGLSPPPPQGSNFANDCSFSFFGAQTGRSLIVGRSEKQGIATKTVARTYMLDAAGAPIAGVSIDGYAFLALIAYLVALTNATGRTLGDRVTRIRVIDVTNTMASAVPLRETVLRYGAMTIGYIPLFVILVAAPSLRTDGAEALVKAPWINWLIAGAVAALVWTAVLVVQVARKLDPVYDRLAGTAAIRVSPHDHVEPATALPQPGPP